jgi:hypothetical protein
MMLGEMCVLSLIYTDVAVCRLCALRCVIIMCFSLLLYNYWTYVLIFFLCLLSCSLILFSIFCILVFVLFCLLFLLLYTAISYFCTGLPATATR